MARTLLILSASLINLASRLFALHVRPVAACVRLSEVICHFHHNFGDVLAELLGNRFRFHVLIFNCVMQ